MKKHSFSIVCLFIFILLPSCSMKQEIYIEKTGSGRVEFTLSLADYLSDVISQVVTLLEPDAKMKDKQKSLFDLEAIEKDFKSRKGIGLIGLESRDNQNLSGEFTFTDINMLLQDVNAAQALNTKNQLIKMEKKDGITELTVRITRETVNDILAENPSLNNPLVANFGPSASEGLTDEEYLDMMEFVLGEQSREGIQLSSLELVIHVEGSIIDQKGGRLADKNTVVYRIPMLPVLMLKKPLEYSLRYR
ncbi:MAG: hypothetical protein B0D92_00935 [Spirochaeta sp. LUC14_002_19_P3]|nr:MAG: hypothetical protein B0D92_00935 [Spirochaeta sp. LUC14_002_19_P3]